MENKDWEKFGEEVRRTVQNAVDSRDFNKLNQAVSDTIGRAMDNVSRGIKNAGAYVQNQNSPGYRPQNQEPEVLRRQREEMLRRQNSQLMQRQAAELARQRHAQLYLKGTSTKIGGIFLAATGFLFGTVSVGVLLGFCVGALLNGWDFIMQTAVIIFGIFALCFLLMARSGTKMAGSVGRFRKYVRIISGREYCQVAELAEQTGRSVKEVVKDLKKMIRKGWFREGHLDEKQTCLMVSENAYDQYVSLMERMEREKEEREAAELRQKQEYEKLSPELQKIVRTGDEYVAKIKAANDAIPGAEISAKISRMETLVDRIFDRVEQNPGAVEDIRKLMEYYLPTTVKLLEAYQELDAQPVQGENIISSKIEIEKTLDTLNGAFEKILDDLFQDTAWDLSSDISVLHTMLAQEGLTEDGLKSAGSPELK